VPSEENGLEKVEESHHEGATWIARTTTNQSSRECGYDFDVLQFAASPSSGRKFKFESEFQTLKRVPQKFRLSKSDAGQSRTTHFHLGGYQDVLRL
jgi:hypothetical protein